MCIYTQIHTQREGERERERDTAISVSDRSQRTRVDTPSQCMISVGRRISTCGSRTQEEKRKNATVVEEPTDGLDQKKNMEEDMVFGNGQTTFSNVDPKY